MLNTRSGVRAGTILGFPIIIDATLILILTVLILWEIQGGLAAFGRSLLFYGIIVASVVLHEVGHAIAVRRQHLGESVIVLSGLGGITTYQGTPSPRQGVIVALAGPGLGIALGLLFLPLWLSAHTWATPTVEHVLFLLVVVNIGFNLANLLPVFPLDGGQVMRFLLLARVSRRKALKTTVLVGSAVLCTAALSLYLYSGFSSFFIWLILAIIASENIRLWPREHATR